MSKMSKKKPLVSFVIPAYNQPDYTIKALDSIRTQTYRPIEIILLDDCSPITLFDIARLFSKKVNGDILFRYYRHKKNLGVVDNLNFGFKQVTGEYLVYWAHDNWFCSNEYLGFVINKMEFRQDCYLALSNMTTETLGDNFLKNTELILNGDDYGFVEGDKILKYWRNPDKSKSINWTQFGIMKYEKAKELNICDPKYSVNREMGNRYGIPPDNVMSWVPLLASVGSVFVSKSISMIAGYIETSYGHSKEWRKKGYMTTFYIEYQLSKINEDLKYIDALNYYAFNQAKHRLNRFSFNDYLLAIRMVGLDYKLLMILCSSILKKLIIKSVLPFWRIAKRIARLGRIIS